MKRPETDTLLLGGTAVAVIAVGLLVHRHRSAKRWPSRGRSTATAASRCNASNAPAKGAVQGGLYVLPCDYPKVRRDEKILDKLHGVKIADPYRWLEDPDSEETRQFIEAQNRVSSRVLGRCETRQQYRDLLQELYDHPRYGCPRKKGGRYYFTFNTGLQAQNVVYTQSQLEREEEPKILMDPNELSEDGTVALMGTYFSEDGKLMTYSLGSGGSDWRTVKIKRVDPASGAAEDLEDTLEHVKFSSFAWTHDHKGFFYNRFAPPEGGAELGTETQASLNQRLYYHTIGTSQAEDAFLLAEPDHPEWMLQPSVTDDGRYLLLSVEAGCEPVNQLWMCDLRSLPTTGAGAPHFAAFDTTAGSQETLPLTKLIDKFEASFEYVANEGSVFTFLTNLKAPTYRLVRTDISKPSSPETWTDVLPGHENDLLQWAAALKGDALVVCYLRDVHSALQLRSLSTGKLQQDIPLPGLGCVSDFSSDRKDSEAFFSYVDYTSPGSTFRIDVSEPKIQPKLFKKAELRGGVSTSDFETRQIFATSKDGTRVPMFITSKKGIKLDGQNPTLLYGYGGFNISLEPNFSVARLCFMLAYNGIYAVANLRGGGEYGIGWREAGSLLNKQNVFDDFQACAEHLIREGYCSDAKLTIQGGSNGGLLVAACANQRPDLFSAVIAQVGVMDMLRFHRFTIGHFWMTDYGDVDKRADFENLLAYSPLHNVRVPAGRSGEARGQYPAMLLTTGSHDDRVVPLHSHKLIATLQHVLGGDARSSAQRNPLLIRVETRAGHGAGKPTAKIIEEAADSYAFAAKAMQASWRHK